MRSSMSSVAFVIVDIGRHDATISATQQKQKKGIHILNPRNAREVDSFVQTPGKKNKMANISENFHHAVCPQILNL